MGSPSNKLLTRPSKSEITLNCRGHRWGNLLRPLLLVVCLQTGRSVGEEKSPPNQPSATPPSVILTSECKPESPTRIARGIQIGTVILAYRIDIDGSVLAAKVKTTSGHPLLDLAALNAIFHCRFGPAKINGQPAIAWVDVTYEFTLNEQKSVGE